MTALELLKAVERAGGKIKADGQSIILVIRKSERERIMKMISQSDRNELISVLTPPGWAGKGCWPVCCGKTIGWKVDPDCSPISVLPVDHPVLTSQRRNQR